MSKVMLGVAAALLLVVAHVGGPLATAGEAMRASGDIPQIVAFDNEDFIGDLGVLRR